MQIDELVDVISWQFERGTDHVFKERVKFNVLSARAEAIRQYLDKYRSYPVSLISQLNCLETEKADIAECCSTKINCKVTKTVDIIPSPIRLKGLSSAYQYVGTIDNSKAFGYIDPNQLQYILADRFMPNNQIFYSYINGKIYIFNSHPTKIRVKGIFNNPYDINTLNDCDGSPECKGNLEIPDDFVTLIKDFVYKEMRNTPIIQQKEEIQLDNVKG
jgi:hypothetical protein